MPVRHSHRLGLFSRRAGSRGCVFGVAAAIALSAGLASPAAAQTWHFDVVNGRWLDAGNWSPSSVPPVFADVAIGSLAGVQNGTVDHDTFDALTMASLTITDGMTLRNSSVGEFIVNGDTLVTGSNTVAGPFGLLTHYPSRLVLNAIKGTTLRTNDLVIRDGARVVMDNAFVRINEDLDIGEGTLLTGPGVVDFYDSGTTLINNGTIRADKNIWQVFRQFGGGLYNLDGNGAGVLDLRTNFGAIMRFHGTALTDDFSSTILLGGEAELEMDLDDGWTADANSVIDYESPPGIAAATITGAPMTLAGTVNIHGTAGWLFLSPETLTIEPSAVFNIEPNHALEVQDVPTTVSGGTFNLDEHGNVNFHGPTTMRGGTFNMWSTSSVEGSVDLWNATEWDGEVTFNGIARQFATATVSGPTVINAGVFAMSASAFDPTEWDINSSVVINAGAINEGSQEFGGTMDITAGFTGRLTLNLSDPGASWVMAGGLTLAGSGAIPVTRIAGSRMVVTGELSVTNGIAQITASTSFIGASVTIPAGATLRTRNFTTVDAASSFVGGGTLHNGEGGTMVLFNSLSLGDVGLANSGVLHVGQLGPATVRVDRFTNHAAGTLRIELAGYADFERDLLIATGGSATLGGMLDVNLLDLGGGVFMPSVGEEFTILRALGGVVGTFLNDPTSMAGGLTYEWTVLYHPNTVVLRLDTITVPSPGAVGLAMLAGLVGGRRRR